jgi:hypothetical protein
MPAIQASRRLVKSPPELWAEVSDAACLARHLGDVGEITITRLEPETTVAWEGEHASGTVELAPAGWGTAVTLTAEPVGEAAEPAATAEPPAPEPEPDPVATAEPEPVATAEPEPVATAGPEDEPEAAAEHEAIGIEETTPIATPSRRGWLTRLLRRRAQAPAPAAQPAATPKPEPSTADADRAGGGEDARAPVDRPGCAHPEPTGPARSSAEPEQEPTPALEAVLHGALDSLGQAHHRPFSRG